MSMYFLLQVRNLSPYMPSGKSYCIFFSSSWCLTASDLSCLLPSSPPRATGAPPLPFGRTPLVPSRRRRRAPPGKARAVPAAVALTSTRARRAWRGSSSLAAVRLGGSAMGDGEPHRSSGVLPLLAYAIAGCSHGGAGSQAQIWAHLRPNSGRSPVEVVWCNGRAGSVVQLVVGAWAARRS
jgi:hypothetical protein